MNNIKIYDIVREGTYNDFIKIYSEDNDCIYSMLRESVLSYAVCGGEPFDDRLKIVKFLVNKGLDVNYISKKEKMNTLHLFYYTVWRPDKDYLFEVTKLLVEHEVNLNTQDFNGSIPMHYLITLNKLLTEDIKEVLVYLVEKGSDYKLKNKYGNSCLDSAKKFEWRNGFLDIVKEYEESKKS